MYYKLECVHLIMHEFNVTFQMYLSALQNDYFYDGLELKSYNVNSFPMASTSSAPPLGNVASTSHQGMIASSVAAIEEHNTALATWNTSVVQGEYHTPSGCCDLKLWAYLCVSVSGTDIFHKY